MIANPEKFHAILLRKNQTSKIINSKETLKLLGATLDYRFDVELHIATQLSVWSGIFSSSKSLHNIEKLH